MIKLENKKEKAKKAAQEYIQGKITISEAAHKAEITILEMEQYLVEEGYKSSYSIYDLDKEIRLLGPEKIKHKVYPRGT